MILDVLLELERFGELSEPLHSFKIVPLGMFLALIQQADIQKKMEEAPDGAYEIGVVIGSYLPFVLLVGIVYAFYYYTKRKKDSE